MFTTVRLFIKTGIGFLGLGLALGAWLLVRRELTGVWPSPYLVSAHVHAVGVGFVMFMILGVALWLFPRAAKDDDRYRPGRVLGAYWLLAAGTVSRLVGETGQAWWPAGPLRWLALAGGLCQVLGLALYFYTMWSRIRPVGSHLREAAGERF